MPLKLEKTFCGSLRLNLPLILAGLVVAASGSAIAQSRSAAIGIAQLSLPQGTSLLANPFNTGTNHLDSILPLPVEGLGATIWRFDNGTGAYREPIIYAGSALGWYSLDNDPALKVIEPGEAFFFQAHVPVTISFMGVVPQGVVQTTIHGGNSFSFVGSPAPQSAAVGQDSDGIISDTGLIFPAEHLDRIYVWDRNTQNYLLPFMHSEGSGWSSTNLGDPGPAGPTIEVGTGFIVFRPQPITSAWARTFDINSSTP